MATKKSNTPEGLAAPAGSARELRDKFRQMREVLRVAASKAPDNEIGDNWHFAFRAADDGFEAMRKIADADGQNSD